MKPDYSQLKTDLERLLTGMADFTPSEVAEVEGFLRVGEYGVAFETLCGIVKEEGYSVPADLRSVIREMAERMGIEPSWWAGIV